jgi:hypothetical protein
MTRILISLAVLMQLLVASAPAQEDVYKSDEFLDRYGERVMPPPLNLTRGLDGLSLAELRYLRNEVYARKGFLFTSADIRAYFQGKPWYQPVWWSKKMNFTPTEEETAFIKRIEAREEELRKRNFTSDGAAMKADIANIINLAQFDSIPDVLLKKLDENGFAIVPSDDKQLFHVYEGNDYGIRPNFVTTDLFLQLFHIYFDFLLRSLEETRFSPMLTRLLKDVQSRCARVMKEGGTGLTSEAAGRASVISAVPLRLLGTARDVQLRGRWKKALDEECGKIASASDRGSAFLQAPQFDYTQFIPRGHYTRSGILKKYFQAMMWLQRAPMLLDTDEGLATAVVLAHCIKSSAEKGGARELLANISGPLSYIAGDPDNISMQDLIAVIDARGGQSLSQLLARAALSEIRAALLARNPERIRATASDPSIREELGRPRLFFFAQSYSPDAEVLQRLVHISRDPKPLRPFPKGLDVPAAFGNPAAAGILKNVYRENDAWPAFDDSLAAVSAGMRGFDKWEASIYNKWFGGIMRLSDVDKRSQPFMCTQAWQKRCLNTALAAWTGLKHDFVLYSKQAEIAECGGMAPPPPPVTVGYVEPNISFWNNACELLENTQNMLTRNGSFSGDLKAQTIGLKEAAGFLRMVSEKELKGEKLTKKMYETIRLMGSTVDQLSLAIMRVENWDEVDGPDRSISLVTDVFTNGVVCLEEAVGKANTIYVVVEIEGYLYLATGGVYSYYEFQQPSSQRLTDEEWQKRLESGRVPDVPVWMKDIIVPIKPLEESEGSSYSSGC